MVFSNYSYARYRGKEQTEKSEIQNVGVKKKRAPGNLRLEPRLVLNEIKRGLMDSGIRGVLLPGKDTTP